MALVSEEKVGSWLKKWRNSLKERFTEKRNQISSFKQFPSCLLNPTLFYAHWATSQAEEQTVIIYHKALSLHGSSAKSTFHESYTALLSILPWPPSRSPCPLPSLVSTQKFCLCANNVTPLRKTLRKIWHSSQDGLQAQPYCMVYSPHLLSDVLWLPTSPPLIFAFWATLTELLAVSQYAMHAHISWLGLYLLLLPGGGSPSSPLANALTDFSSLCLHFNDSYPDSSVYILHE